MFTKEIFLRGLAEQCSAHKPDCKEAWKLAAEGVFVAKLKEEVDIQPLFVFYYDTRETRLRDQNLMNHKAQALIQTSHCYGFRFISGNMGTLRSFSLEQHGVCPLGNVTEAHKYAQQFFVTTHGGEIDWLYAPEQLQLAGTPQ